MIWIIMGISLILFLWLLYGYSMNFFLKTENYTINSPRIAKSFKAVLLADLHSASFGKKNEKLIRMIDKESPDLILMAGDMVVKNGKKLCVTKAFLKALSNKYPVYYSPGNHEIRMPDYEEYKNFLTDLGITYLENEQVYLPEYDLTITGLDLPEYYYHKCWQKRTFTKDTMDQTAGFNTQKGCQLLLAHNPEYIPVYRQWGAEITCSGHLHGGIMILPFLGGVLSPSLRLFPTYDQGVFREDGAVHIVSRGLGLHHLKFRFFNTPELSVINFTCTRVLK